MAQAAPDRPAVAQAEPPASTRSGGDLLTQTGSVQAPGTRTPVAPATQVDRTILPAPSRRNGAVGRTEIYREPVAATEAVPNSGESPATRVGERDGAVRRPEPDTHTPSTNGRAETPAAVSGSEFSDAKLKVSFSNTASSSGQALSGNEGLAKVLIQLMESQGVKRENIAIFSATLTPIQQSSGGFQYRADNDAQITLSKVTDYEKVINALFAANYTNISNVVFTSDRAKDLEKQALDLAIKDAKEKGQQIAKSSGKMLGKIISITTQDSQTAEKSIGEASEKDVAAPSKIEIVKSASVIYELK